MCTLRQKTFVNAGRRQNNEGSENIMQHRDKKPTDQSLVVNIDV